MPFLILLIKLYCNLFGILTLIFQVVWKCASYLKLSDFIKPLGMSFIFSDLIPSRTCKSKYVL